MEPLQEPLARNLACEPVGFGAAQDLRGTALKKEIQDSRKPIP